MVSQTIEMLGYINKEIVRAEQAVLVTVRMLTEPFNNRQVAVLLELSHCA